MGKTKHLRLTRNEVLKGQIAICHASPNAHATTHNVRHPQGCNPTKFTALRTTFPTLPTHWSHSHVDLCPVSPTLTQTGRRPPSATPTRQAQSPTPSRTNPPSRRTL